MKNTEIVPNKAVRNLSPREIQNLCNQVAEVAAVYEEANISLEELDENMYNLESVGERYNELTSSVRNRVAACCSKGILKEVISHAE